tara:strand:+ start:3162 stop:4445 length:1284 start_codon:yes stop_codon:yes gene_type:complete
MSTVQLSPPPAVHWITDTLQKAGHDTWAVGGAVRDILSGHYAGDWDLTTQARPRQIEQLFKRTVPIGIEHGTVGVLARDGTLFEVTTFRKDIETDGRHAVVTFADTIEEDLARRDFTINALAWHPIEQKLLDPFGGLKDLEAGVLKTVGVPEKRFAEDYLRILRAFRFAGRFDLRIDEASWKALCDGTEHLRGLSCERVRDELLKALDQHRIPSRTLSLYAKAGALGVLYPELDELRTADHSIALNRWEFTLASIDELPPGNAFLRLAQFLHLLDPKKVVGILVRLRFSNAQTDETSQQASASALPGLDANDEAIRRWLSSNSPERLNALARLELARARAHPSVIKTPSEVVDSWRRARLIRATGVPLSISDLAIGGNDLIRIGLRPGPNFSRILEDLLDFVLTDPTQNERGILRAHVEARLGAYEE